MEIAGSIGETGGKQDRWISMSKRENAFEMRLGRKAGPNHAEPCHFCLGV